MSSQNDSKEISKLLMWWIAFGVSFFLFFVPVPTWIGVIAVSVTFIGAAGASKQLIIWILFGISFLLFFAPVPTWIGVIAVIVTFFGALGASGAAARKKEKRLKVPADQGDIQAQYDLACLYQKCGELSKAIPYFEKAAKAGHAQAQSALKKAQAALEAKRQAKKEREAKKERKRVAALLDKALHAKDQKKRLEAVECLTDQAALVDIAKNANDSEVRKKAVERLTDQAALADIAKNGKNSSERHAAIERLTDQALLADIAKNAEDSVVRKKAVERLTDQAALADIAKHEKTGLCDEAVECLTDQVALTDVAKNGKIPRVRLKAADKLDDKALAKAVYVDVAENCEFPNMRHYAAERLTMKKEMEDIKNRYRDSDDKAYWREYVQTKIADLESQIKMEQEQVCKYCGQKTKSDKYVGQGEFFIGEKIQCPYGYDEIDARNCDPRMSAVSEIFSYGYVVGDKICPKLQDAARKYKEKEEWEGVMQVIYAVDYKLKEEDHDRRLRRLGGK